MNYSFIEPYFNAKFASKGENVAAEMLPMNLRQDILQRVERSERSFDARSNGTSSATHRNAKIQGSKTPEQLKKNIRRKEERVVE